MSLSRTLRTAAICATVLGGGWLIANQYLQGDFERNSSRDSPEQLPFPKPQPIPNLELLPVDGPLRLVDPGSSGVRMDPAHPLKVGRKFYPASSRKANEEGKCVVRITVMPDGHIQNAFVQVGSGSARLDQACLNAVNDGRMLPAMEASKPIETTISISLVWKLPN